MSFTKRNARKVTHWSPFKVVMLIGLIAYTVCMFGLLLWAFVTSFKEQADFRINVIGLPQKWVWNYKDVFNNFKIGIMTDEGTEYVGVLEMYLNSFLFAGGVAFFGTLCSCITSYLCARFNFFFSKVIYTVVIIVMILPIVGNLPAEIRMVRALGLYDHIWGIWIMNAHFLGIYFLVFYNIFKSLPMTYTEAAKVDGAGNWMILTRIIMPLVRNTFWTVVLIQFIHAWNNYQTPLLYLPSHPTLAWGVYHVTNHGSITMATVPMKITAAMMVLIPTLLLFLCFNKRLLGSLTVGGIKG